MRQYVKPAAIMSGLTFILWSIIALVVGGSPLWALVFGAVSALVTFPCFLFLLKLTGR